LIFGFESHDIHPLIFYRLSKPLKQGKELPKLEISDYIQTEGGKFELEVIPDYSCKISEKCIEENKEVFSEFEEAFKLNEDELKSKELLNVLWNSLNRSITVDILMNWLENSDSKLEIDCLELPINLTVEEKSKFQKIVDIYLAVNVNSLFFLEMMEDLLYVKNMSQNEEDFSFRKEFLLC
jgi:hypothetical protein